MFPRPKRQKRPKMNIRESEVIRCPGHLSWQRGNCCAVQDAFCEGRIEVAHVRIGTNGGTGMKPGDDWTVPLCAGHHREQHQRGEPKFWYSRKIDPRELAQSYWQLSPHGRKWRMEHK